MGEGKKAIVLLSGGLDSATTLYMANDAGYRCFCLIFDYGQRHRREVISARSIARQANCPFRIIRFNLPWGGSALLDKKTPIPSGSLPGDTSGQIPSTYVPARNTIFLGFAVSWAEAIEAEAVFIGAHHRDSSGYPDCRPAYYEAVREVIKRGTKRGAEGKDISVEIPLIDKTKKEIIEIGTRLGVPYQLSWSCYRGESRPCGVCDSCLLRAKGFKEAGIKDPLIRGR